MSDNIFDASELPAPAADPDVSGMPGGDAPRGSGAITAEKERDPGAASRWRAVAGFLRGFSRDLTFFIFLFLFIYYFVMNVSVVRGKSMEPNFHDGDRLIVDKLSYRISDIRPVNRFDVVVLKNPYDPSEDYIKRLVGFPGEWIEIRGGALYIDGERCTEPEIYVDPTRNFGPEKVKEGHYFVLGDNRGHSNDSLNFGGVPKDYIKGKIRVRFWPLDEFTVFK